MLSITEILDTIKSMEGLSKDTEIAAIFKVRQSMLTMWRKRGTIPYENLLRYCEERSMDPLWLLSGKGPKYRGASQASPVKHPQLSLMTEVIETVEEVFEREGLSLPPAKKARLITLIYEEISEDASKLSTIEQKVVKLTKLAS
jgi:hypothetical protein